MGPRRSSRRGRGTRSGIDTGGRTATPEPGATTGDNPPVAGDNPYTPGTALPPANPYAPGTTLAEANPPTSSPVQTPSSSPCNPRVQQRPNEDDRTYRRRLAAREAASAMQARRRARLRAAQDAEETAGEPRRKIPRAALIEKLNICDARVTRSAIERDEELNNCLHCARGGTWPLKCHGGDVCTECEARDMACIRGHRRNFDVNRARQLQGVEPWNPKFDQCRQCKSRGSQCNMPNGVLPGPCDQCREDGLPCDIEPLRVRRCPTCKWEHKCIECAKNHLRCDGQIPCLVCLRKNIECVGLKPDGSCPDIHMSMYGTGLPPCPQRTAVIQSREQRNWPPPSGRLEILENALMEGVPGYELINFVPGPAGVVIARQRPESSSSPPSGQPSEGEPTFSSPGLGRTPGFDPNNFRTSLYNPFDDDKPPCSHCAADHENRLCDQGTPCFECLQRDIVDAENCRTSRPCGLCFMNEMPCDAGTPCQNCMFLGFGEVECRPGGISPQKYFPNDDGTIYESQSEDEPYIHLPGTRPTPDFNYSCAFCVAYGHQGCDPRDRPCLPCVQHNRTALQCRFEERCARCIELDVPCDGKMPCSLCANADGLASMMCLGRGDTTIPGAMTSLPAEEGGDIMMGEAGDYPGFGNGFSPAVTGEPFAPAVAPSGAFIDPSLLAQNEVPKVPPGGFFHPPPHVRMQLLPHYRIRTDVHNTGYFDPVPGVHNSWNPFTDDSRCKEVLPNGEPCGTLPAIHCDGGAEHGDEGWSVCGGCRKLAEEGTVHLLEEIEEKKNLFCCATCSQAQMNKFSSGTGFENMETLVDYHCDCDAQMRAWLCYACKYKVIHTVGDRMISTREKLTRDSDNAILCPRCGVEPGDKEAAYHLAKGVARCSSCWYWINYAK